MEVQGGGAAPEDDDEEEGGVGGGGGCFDELLRRLSPHRGAGSGGENRLMRVKCSGRAWDWEALVPLAQPIVPWVDARRRRLRICPPAGLLELGERPALLAWLEA